MGKVAKILLSLIVIVIVFTGIIVYTLKPKERYDVSSQNNEIIDEEYLSKGSYINSMEVVKNPLRMVGKVSVSEDEFRNLIYTLMHKHGIKELENNFVEMKDGKIKVAGPYKVFGLINSQYELELIPTLKGENLIVSLENVKLGKFKISDKMLEKILSNYNKKVPFEVNGNKITLEKSYLYPVTLKNISIKKGNIDLDMEVEIDLKSQINGALGYLKDSGKAQDILNHLINLKKTAVG
ncbi:DUF2140 domain-containing protein [Clostridioides sp. GD02404]|uniref:DUF2140 domain-containing protein n=1 Tax=Clostridioides sp. GD02404 TaxID=3054354 RepID=UPI0038A020C5